MAVKAVTCKATDAPSGESEESLRNAIVSKDREAIDAAFHRMDLTTDPIESLVTRIHEKDMEAWRRLCAKKRNDIEKF